MARKHIKLQGIKFTKNEIILYSKKYGWLHLTKNRSMKLNIIEKWLFKRWFKKQK